MTARTGSIGTAVALGVPTTTDVAVIGAGAAGLMTALAAAIDGADVLVLESQPLVGGTSAISGGSAWVPAHDLAPDLMADPDSRDEARRYILGEGRDAMLDRTQVDAFLDAAPRMVRFIEEHTRLSWIPMVWPDYRSDIPGAKNTRSLFPGPFAPGMLGDAAAFVRPPKRSGMSRSPLPLWLLNGIQGVSVGGGALIGALLEACLRHDVQIRVEAPCRRLVTSGAGVVGVAVEQDGAEHEVSVARGVVLASGGWEADEVLTARHLGGSLAAQVSPRGHEGDGIRMAKDAGAAMTALEEAWWMPAMQVPGEEMDGTAISRLVLGERGLPHTIIVNSAGQRFANESAPYDVFGAAMRSRDPDTGRMPNATAWMIFDDYYRRHYGFFGRPPGSELEAFVHRADTLEELGARSGVDPDGLRRTVDLFNAAARRGEDPAFDRGATAYERYFGDSHPLAGRLSPDRFAPALATRARLRVAKMIGPVAGSVLARISQNPARLRATLVPALAMKMRLHLDNPRASTLGPVDQPPYYAVQIESSAIGTLGGPATDTSGRVLDQHRRPIPGLYAAGNAGGAVTRGFYAGAGGTISLALTFGYLAGRHAAQRPALAAIQPQAPDRA